MTADKSELEMAIIDGVKMLHHSQVVRIADDTVKCVKVEKSIAKNGAVTFTEDYQAAFEVPADSVIIAIGQGPGSDVANVGSASVTQRGLLQVDEFGQTSQEEVSSPPET